MCLFAVDLDTCDRSTKIDTKYIRNKYKEINDIFLNILDSVLKHVYRFLSSLASYGHILQYYIVIML